MPDIPAWSADLAVGHPEIDLQHRKMLGLCRSLYTSCSAGSTTMEALHVVLNDFAECLMQLFRTEEQVLARSGCPRFEQHKTEHDALCECLSDLLFQATHNGPDRAAWMQVAVRWSNHHLHNTDLRDRIYLQQR